MQVATRSRKASNQVPSRLLLPEMKRHAIQTAVTLLSSLLFIMAGTACTGSMYDWEVRTESAPLLTPFQSANFAQHPVAVFPAITMPGLRGNEFTLGHYLGYILRKEDPTWQVVTELESSSRINRKGLAPELARMRNDYDQSSIFDADTLRRIGTAIGVRYVFQPRLAAFSQTMMDRWMFPGLNVRLLQTRSSIMRVSLQLWDTETGDLMWVSMAETTMTNEAVSQEPVLLHDIAVATLGSMVADFKHERTASQYPPLNTFLDALIQDTKPPPIDRSDRITK
jgi:hypothetical protein